MSIPPYMSDDRFLWTDVDPDAELIEPRILASIDKNRLIFGFQNDRPPQARQFTLYNHGDHAFAFKIQTSDNYAYFVSKVYGVVMGRQLHALPFVRTVHSETITVYRRPTKEFKAENEYPYHIRTTVPRKDRLIILIAPIFGWTTEPASLFNHTKPFEKLRICLEYKKISSEQTSGNFATALLHSKRPGWRTW